MPPHPATLCPKCDAAISLTDLKAGECTICGAVLALWLAPENLDAMIDGIRHDAIRYRLPSFTKRRITIAIRRKLISKV